MLRFGVRFRAVSTNHHVTAQTTLFTAASLLQISYFFTVVVQYTPPKEWSCGRRTRTEQPSCGVMYTTSVKDLCRWFFGFRNPRKINNQIISSSWHLIILKIILMASALDLATNFHLNMPMLCCERVNFHLWCRDLGFRLFKYVLGGVHKLRIFREGVQKTSIFGYDFFFVMVTIFGGVSPP